jgi:hypothetical protein
LTASAFSGSVGGMPGGGWARSWMALVVLATHVWLTPFAFANPPDSLATGGAFDGGDLDDIVLVVMAMHGLVDTQPVFDGVPVEAASLTQAVEPAPPPSVPARALEIRAPPA